MFCPLNYETLCERLIPRQARKSGASALALAHPVWVSQSPMSGSN